MAKKICFIGAGNLATHLAQALFQAGENILQVYSRTEESAKMLATKVEAKSITRTEEISADADIYIVALKDGVVKEVLSEINFQNKPIVHCSGSLPMEVLNDFSENIGVFYPLQTFTKKRALNFAEIPVFVEANNNELLVQLKKLGEKVSEKVSELSSDKRKDLHVAAVFACNFVNHFYNLAGEYLQASDIPFEVLRPLITETAAKVQHLHPNDAQTGPAVRFDKNIIEKHQQELTYFPEMQELYLSVSKSIFNHHQNK